MRVAGTGPCGSAHCRVARTAGVAAGPRDTTRRRPRTHRRGDPEARIVVTETQGCGMPWLPIDAPQDVANERSGTNVRCRLRNELIAEIPHNSNMLTVRRNPAPMVPGTCESLPTVMSVPPRLTYKATICGPGMLVRGDWRSPDVLISNEID